MTACPKCGSPEVAPLQHGHPGDDPGVVYSGLCMPHPEWLKDRACRACGRRWTDGEPDAGLVELLKKNGLMP